MILKKLVILVRINTNTKNLCLSYIFKELKVDLKYRNIHALLEFIGVTI